MAEQDDLVVQRCLDLMELFVSLTEANQRRVTEFMRELAASPVTNASGS